uniref:Uncharacterized protein n=1 Tax=Ditylenchus dipsaci TaxID=166011 RepID=A0A915DKJ3_9BILA
MLDKASDITHKGLLMVRILAPKDLKLAVMPFRTSNGLVFPLCAKCATNNSSSCQHEDEKRAFIATSAHIELELALERGYVVDRVFKFGTINNGTPSCSKTTCARSSNESTS